MPDQRSSPIARQWIWPYAAAAGLWAYGCSRGSDGQLFAALLGFGLLGVIYFILIWRDHRLGAIAGLKHLLVAEAAVVLALAINPQLEEMAGMLNFLIPALVAVTILSAWLARRIRSRAKG